MRPRPVVFFLDILNEVVQSLYMSFKPPRRYLLKAKIIEKGYWYDHDFALEIGVDRSNLNKVLNGFEFPSEKMQRKMTKALDLTLTELGALL